MGARWHELAGRLATHLGQELGLAEHVEYDVARAHSIVDAVDLVARLTVIIALVPVADVLDVEELLALGIGGRRLAG